MVNVQRVQRDRPLTTAEAAEYDRIRQEVARELPDLLAQAADPRQCYSSFEDLEEADQFVAFLRAERERQGLSLDQIAERTDLPAADVAALEEGRDCSPALAVLARYARALGRRVILSLHMGTAYAPEETAVEVAQ